MYPTTAIPTHPPWAPAGGARGCNCTPWNLKMMTSYAVCKQNAPKLLLAPPVLARISLKQGMKTQKLTKNHLFCFWRTKVRRIVSALARMQLENYICTWVHITSAPPWKTKYFLAPPCENFCRRPCTRLLLFVEQCSSPRRYQFRCFLLSRTGTCTHPGLW